MCLFPDCDPHPGNILIRPHPTKSGVPQLVLLDHGLYVHVDEKTRREYALLWKALLSTDTGTIESIAKDWGIGAPDLFASSTLMRPVRLRKSKGPSKKDNNSEPDFSELSQYEQSVRMKAKLKTFLIDTDRLPKALLFLGRNIRMVQGMLSSLLPCLCSMLTMISFFRQ
jgi:aarF domain-containing kinase